MENITKALLIAGGILIVIMVLTLVMTVVNQISTYYSAQHDEKVLEQTLDFNSKFENCAGQTIRGNELLSVVNRVIDYNNYQADMEGYEPITLYVDLHGHEGEFIYDGSISVEQVIPGEINNENMNTISNLSRELTSEASGIKGLTETKLQKLASEISNIADEDKYSDEKLEEYKRYRLERLTKILGRDVVESEVNAIQKATCLYYQLTQFKRAMFKCKEISYNTENGRVNKMEFDVVIQNGQIKLE